MSPLLFIAPAIVVFALAGGSSPATQDCLMSIVPEQGSNGAVVVNTGSTTGTNGAGCDGCTVDTVRIEVTWAHTDWAWILGAGGNMTFNVQAGDVSKLSWPANVALDCDKTVSVSAIQPVPVGSGSGTSSILFKCNSCQ